MPVGKDSNTSEGTPLIQMDQEKLPGKEFKKEDSATKQNLFMAFLVAGTLISFTVFGYAQEAVTKQKYDGERFQFPFFLVLLQSTFNTCLSGVYLFVTRNPDFTGGAPLQSWLIVSSAYLGAHFFGIQALAFIPFPMQVVCKSIKTVPVMFGEKILAGKVHSMETQVSVFLMTAGVVVFALVGGSKGGKDSEWALTPSLAIGMMLVMLALCCDGIYGPYQNKIVKQHSPSQFHLMFNMNVYEAMMAFVLAGVTGEIFPGCEFILSHPEIIPNLSYFMATMGIGNIFIYALQRNFGSLVVTTTTTLRKLISVVFSVLWFGHSLAPEQWACVGVVFFAKYIAQFLVGIFGGGGKKVGAEKHAHAS